MLDLIINGHIGLPAFRDNLKHPVQSFITKGSLYKNWDMHI